MDRITLVKSTFVSAERVMIVWTKRAGLCSLLTIINHASYSVLCSHAISFESRGKSKKIDDKDIMG